jgi:GNAT superfamily N-acetyltransferase
MVSEHEHLIESMRSAHIRETAFDPRRFEIRLLRPKGRPHAWLALRPVRSSDAEALQSYFRGLSPQSRYNRILGAANELPPSELARTLAANGRDMLSLLLTATSGDRETVVGEARAAFSCEERVGEISISIADDWRRLGVGSALIEEIERKAASEGIEQLFGDVLPTNEAMIALALSRGFHLQPGLEGRLVRIQKRLDAAPDLPCLKWAEIAGGAKLSAAGLDASGSARP